MHDAHTLAAWRKTENVRRASHALEGLILLAPDIQYIDYTPHAYYATREPGSIAESALTSASVER